ncbi:hypothetical protein Sfulv_32470 [Streptomyces fulvorobeus]|uniref:Uncharacterized protein n=1 Tax=Streptomyces fulvorobeus TaxID=284028 RepID=A0A7J0C9M8_9ACTN|nr:hypothetical protein Sfulv_32470 [Streptomyces fulvorobeus]
MQVSVRQDGLFGRGVHVARHPAPASGRALHVPRDAPAAAALLGLDYSEARFGSVDEIYRSESGRDILTEPTLLFADAGKDGAAAVAAQGR